MSVQSAFSQSFPMPIGCVVNFLGQTVPKSFLLCDGSPYNISDYPYLFNTLKDAYGGDGITTFSVPNLINEFITGIAENTNPPTYTVAGGTFSGNFNFGNLTTAKLPANITCSPTLPSLGIGWQSPIGYVNGVIKFDGNLHTDDYGNASGSDASLFQYFGNASLTPTPQWDITSTQAYGNNVNASQSGVSGSIANVTGVPSYLALKFIIKASP